MSTIDTSPSDNGRGSESWLRSWPHLGIDRPSPGYCRVTFDPPPINAITATTVLELAELIWRKVHGTGPDAPPFRYVQDEPYAHDVRRRIPDVSKAKRVLGFEATTPLADVLDEVIPWVRGEMAAGRI